MKQLLFASVSTLAAPDRGERAHRALTRVPTLSSGCFGIAAREPFVFRISHATVRQFTDCLIKGIIPLRARATVTTQETRADSRERRLDV